MASPPPSPIDAEPQVHDPQRDFLRLALGHARWFAGCFGAEGDAINRWLDDGLACYPLALGKAMPDRRPQLFWRAMLGAELPGGGNLPEIDDRHPVEELLAQLDASARAAFLLRVWHDFDDELLADLLGLRVGQVRVGLMRAFGLMRARLDDAGDGSGDSGQWLLAMRARLAGLTAKHETQGLVADERRLDRLYGLPAVVAASEATRVADGTEASEAPVQADRVEDADHAHDTDPEMLASMAALRATSLATAALIAEAEVHEAASAAAGARRAPTRGWPPLLRWVLPSAVVLLFALGWWWLRSPAPQAPLVATSTSTSTSTPMPASSRAPAAGVPPASSLPSHEVEAVLASPDLPLLGGRLTPAQLAVMDQLRWWSSTRETPDIPAQSTDAAVNDAPPDDVPEPPAGFEQLDASDRSLLRSFATLWPRLGDEQRRILMDNARRWRVMDAATRERVIQRSQSFGELPAEMRTRARDSFALWQSLPAGEREQLVAAYAAFSRITPEQQRVVAEDFARLTPSEQAQWRFAAGERELLALAGRVFSFVPEAERSETLALLQSMDEPDRDRLRQGTRRMSAWQREQLRKALLAEPPDSRGEWLKRRFGG